MGKKKTEEAKRGDLRVWWVPQVPMKAFHVPVKNLREAALTLDTLARYDLFQYENRVKPDYANAGGLAIFDPDSDPDGDGWCDWSHPETGEDFDEYRARESL